MINLTFRFDADASAFERRLDESRQSIAARLRAGVEAAGLSTLLEPLRADTAKSLRSRKLPTTWRITIFPTDASIQTFQPAAFVFSKAPKIIAAFEAGATIHPLNGRRYLWIPTENVPTTTGGKHQSPRDMEARVGKFRFA